MATTTSRSPRERRAVLKAGFLGLASLAVPLAFAGTVGASVLGRAEAGVAAGTATPAASGPGNASAAPTPPGGRRDREPERDGCRRRQPTPAGLRSIVARVSQISSAEPWQSTIRSLEIRVSW